MRKSIFQIFNAKLWNPKLQEKNWREETHRPSKRNVIPRLQLALQIICSLASSLCAYASLVGDTQHYKKLSLSVGIYVVRNVESRKVEKLLCMCGVCVGYGGGMPLPCPPIRIDIPGFLFQVVKQVFLCRLVVSSINLTITPLVHPGPGHHYP